MNERLQALLRAVQQTAADINTAADQAANAVGGKASELLTVGKLNIRQTELQNQVDEALRQVGAMVYATHTGDPTSSDDLLEQLRVIDGLNAQLSDVRAQLARLRAGRRVCPQCASPAAEGDVFCRECGAPL